MPTKAAFGEGKVSVVHDEREVTTTAGVDNRFKDGAKTLKWFYQHQHQHQQQPVQDPSAKIEYKEFE